jgi:hypothetical protein
MDNTKNVRAIILPTVRSSPSTKSYPEEWSQGQMLGTRPRHGEHTIEKEYPKHSPSPKRTRTSKSDRGNSKVLCGRLILL